MTTELITVSPNETIEKIKTIFDTYNIHHLPVLEDHRLVGIISKADLLFFRQVEPENFTIYDRALEATRLKRYIAKDIMTRRMVKIEEDEPIRTAIALFKLNRFHALPVIKNNRLAGIVSTFDIIKTLDEEKVVLEDYRLN